MALPIRDMLDEGLLKQVTGRQFQFKQDTEVTVAEHLKFTFNAGEVIRFLVFTPLQKLFVEFLLGRCVIHGVLGGPWFESQDWLLGRCLGNDGCRWHICFC